MWVLLLMLLLLLLVLLGRIHRLRWIGLGERMLKLVNMKPMLLLLLLVLLLLLGIKLMKTLLWHSR